MDARPKVTVLEEFVSAEQGNYFYYSKDFTFFVNYFFSTYLIDTQGLTAQLLNKEFKLSYKLFIEISIFKVRYYL